MSSVVQYLLGKRANRRWSGTIREQRLEFSNGVESLFPLNGWTIVSTARLTPGRGGS